MATNPSSNPPAELGAVLAAVRGFARWLGRLSRSWGPILALLWYGLIFAISSQPSGVRPGPITGSWALNTGHSFLFGLLALWILLSLPRRDGWPVVQRAQVCLVLGCVLVLGLLDELHQSSVPGRTMSATDILTDLTGASCVLWICAYAATSSATERGARSRLLISIAACCLAGAFATFADNLMG